MSNGYGWSTQQERRDLNRVINLDESYGYGQEEKEEEEKQKYEWLKILLNHLNEKKKMYMTPVV